MTSPPPAARARSPRLRWAAATFPLATALAVALLASHPAGRPVNPVAVPAPAHAAPAATPLYGPPLPYPPASVQVLLSAGDRAQLVGHAREAVGFYDQILRENPGDPRAPEAAFTAGRLLLHALDRPRQAAERFAQARRLAPDGPMAEDALAQEIASWARAGRPARARARAEEFRALYPTAPLPELISLGG